MNQQPITAYPQPALYVDGVWMTEATGGSLAVCSPTTGVTLGHLPLAGADEVRRVLASAQAGQKAWRLTAPHQRRNTLMKAAALLRERADQIAVLMTLEIGKPISESRTEVLRSAELIEWMAEEGRRTYGSFIPAPSGTYLSTRLEPIGVVAAFTPWNIPVVSPARKISTALAAGCACIVKASEQTPASAVAVVKTFVDAGLPMGALSLLFGEPNAISSQLIASNVVRLVSLTGSVAVGKLLAEQAARAMKPCIMELGGHAAVVVCDDVDAVQVARKAASQKYRNAGQLCVSPTRFLVQEEIYAQFLDEFVQCARAVRIGDPLSNAVDMGPLSSDRRLRSIENLIRDARETGARVACGGERLPGGGHFFAPTVLTYVPDTAAILQEEPFGPIAVIQKFKHLDEAISMANSVPYGLAAYVFTRSLDAANRLVDGLDVGVVGLNQFATSSPETPFGGNRDSGYGREGGVDGIRPFLTTKAVIEARL